MLSPTIQSLLPRAVVLRGPGRPKITDDESRPVRETHFEVATERLCRRRRFKEIARDFGISIRHAKRVVKAAPNYPDAPPHLRRFASAS